MKSLADCRLYAFVDTLYLRGRSPEWVCGELCKGGADLVQLRAKNSTLDEARRMAERILPITSQAQVALVINDHLSLARQIGADFCHLGQEDFFGPGRVRVSELESPGANPRIGLSTHAPDQGKRALEAGAHYIAVGPVYATGTKPHVKPVTLDYVRWAANPANGVKVPWFAIGGINLDNLDDVLAAGATRICVVSAILDAPDVGRACAEFRRRLP